MSGMSLFYIVGSCVFILGNVYMLHSGFIQFYDEPHSIKDVDRIQGDTPHVSFMDTLDGIPVLALPKSLRTTYSDRIHVNPLHAKSEPRLRRLMENPNKSFPQEIRELNGAFETKDELGPERVNLNEPGNERVNQIVNDKHDKGYSASDNIYLPSNVGDDISPSSVVSVSGKELRTELNKTSSCRDLQALWLQKEYIASGWTKAVYSTSLRGVPVALKTVDVTGHDMSKCGQELALSPTLCYIRASQKILREILLLTALRHTNVVQVIIRN